MIITPLVSVPCGFWIKRTSLQRLRLLAIKWRWTKYQQPDNMATKSLLLAVFMNNDRTDNNHNKKNDSDKGNGNKDDINSHDDKGSKENNNNISNLGEPSLIIVIILEDPF